MNITTGPRGVLEINEARIIYRNFKGEQSQYNAKGDRNFAVIIPTEELANQLIEDGWNVKIKDPREEGDTPFMFLPVKIKFNERGPHVYLTSGKSFNRLTEETAGQIDDVKIVSCDMDIRPYDWEINGKCGRTAYLQSINVIQELDRFSRLMESYEEQ